MAVLAQIYGCVRTSITEVSGLGQLHAERLARNLDLVSDNLRT